MDYKSALAGMMPLHQTGDRPEQVMTKFNDVYMLHQKMWKIRMAFIKKSFIVFLTNMICVFNKMSFQSQEAIIWISTK